MQLEKELNKFGKFVVQQSKSNLTRKGNRDTSALYNSLSFDLEKDSKGFNISFSMEDYGKFKDLGVQGKSSTTKAPNSPFRFGSGTGKKGGLTNAITSWVKRNQIQFRNRKTGRFITSKSTAFIIIRSIYNTGIKPTNFFTRPFELGFKKLPDEILEAYGLDLEEELKKALA